MMILFQGRTPSGSSSLSLVGFIRCLSQFTLDSCRRSSFHVDNDSSGGSWDSAGGGSHLVVLCDSDSHCFGRDLGHDAGSVRD